MAAPAVLEQHYRYPVPSAVVPAHPGTTGPARLRLATSGGPAANPRFFVGTLVRPVVAADLLLAVGDVVRARFHVPSAMLARILLTADPVVTCADDRIRVEGFSACCSAYARVDLLDTEQGPVVIELELTEPSLFFGTAPGSADRLVTAVLRHLKSLA